MMEAFLHSDVHVLIGAVAVLNQVLGPVVQPGDEEVAGEAGDLLLLPDGLLAGLLAELIGEEQVAHIKSIFRVESDLAKACEGVDCVIEAVVEVEDVKHKLFQQIDKVVGKDVIIATNSSFMVHRWRRSGRSDGPCGRRPLHKCS